MLSFLRLKGGDLTEEKHLFWDQTPPAASNLDVVQTMWIKSSEWNVLCHNLPN